MQAWVYIKGNLQKSDDRIALLRRAKAAGCSGVILADILLGIPSALTTDPFRSRLRRLLDEAAALDLRVVLATLGVGWSPDALATEPNLAEAQPVTAKMTVSPDRKRLVVADPAVALDGGFGKQWVIADKDARIRWDVPHLGTRSLAIATGTRPAYAQTTLPTRAGAQYHVSWWAKTDAFYGAADVRATDPAGQLFWFDKSQMPVAPTQTWTRYDYAFIARGPTTLSVTVPGPSNGTVWFDSVAIEETALVNVVRRSGAPLKVRDAVSGRLYLEIADYLVAGEPGGAGGTFRPWHPPQTIAIQPTSRLLPGQRVDVGYYATTPVYWNGRTSQNSVCLTDPAAIQWANDVVDGLAGLDVWGVLAGYDEIRHGNTCASCVATSRTSGDLLAEHIDRTLTRLRGVLPGARQMLWSDMVGGHNERAVGFYVFGSWEGASKGVPAGTLILNWERKSDAEAVAALKHYRDVGLEQWVAGYYDTGDGAKAAKRERGWQATAGVEVLAMVYTTWRDDYGELERYVAGVLG